MAALSPLVIPVLSSVETLKKHTLNRDSIRLKEAEWKNIDVNMVREGWVARLIS